MNKQLWSIWRKYSLLEGIENMPPGFLEGSLYKDVLYHGTDHRFKPGKQLDTRGPEFGIYLTPRLNYARGYGSNLVKVLVNFQHPLFIEDKSEISPRDLTKDDVDKLKSKGYDSIVVTSSSIDSASEIILFEPTQTFIIEVK